MLTEGIGVVVTGTIVVTCAVVVIAGVIDRGTVFAIALRICILISSAVG